MLIGELGAAALAAAAVRTVADPTVQLASGVVVGTTTRVPEATAAVNQFLGMPFADTPPERFAPPRPVKPWSKPIKADKPSAACIQKFNYPEKARNFSMAIYNNPFGAPPAESEDCLYLNVFAPSTPAPEGGRAVMFWVFGGGLNFGTANLNIYDGSSFAANQDVIIVTANYRTNVFGFPVAPQVPRDKTNLGLMDQQLALQWVQDNIGRFGGDPRKVTVFGESAGATSIDDFITSNEYVEKGAPFRAAIMQSGQDTFGPLRANKGNSSAWPALVAGLQCGADPNSPQAFDCVKKAPAARIKSVEEQGGLQFIAVVDGGNTVAAAPLAKRLAGQFVKVPILFGTNSQEGRVFQVGQNNLNEFIAQNFAMFPLTQAAIKQAYPVVPPQTDYDVISEVWTDYLFTCAAQQYAKTSILSNIPAWRYYYNATFSNVNPLPQIPLGAFHSSEIPLVYGTYDHPGANPPKQQVELSATMQKAWADFAKNPEAGPGWQRLSWPQAAVADLGSNGGTKPVMFDPQKAVDARCDAFAEAYTVESLI